MLLVDVAKHIQCSQIVLCGGVFQNALLLKLSEVALTERGFTLYTPQLFATDDGGLSLGQSFITMHQLAQQHQPA